MGFWDARVLAMAGTVADGEAGRQRRVSYLGSDRWVGEVGPTGAFRSAPSFASLSAVPANGKRSDGAVRALIADAEESLARGDPEAARALFEQASRLLVEGGSFEEAIQLLVRRRDFGRAGEIAARSGELARAAQLWARGGELGRAARAREQLGDRPGAVELYEQAGEPDQAARLLEEEGAFTRAALLFERAGAATRAADAWVRAVMSSGASELRGPDAPEACRRAARLYAAAGQLDRAVQLLRWSGQWDFAGQLLAEAGRVEEAHRLLVEAGEMPPLAPLIAQPIAPPSPRPASGVPVAPLVVGAQPRPSASSGSRLAPPLLEPRASSSSGPRLSAPPVEGRAPTSSTPRLSAPRPEPQRSVSPVMALFDRELLALTEDLSLSASLVTAPLSPTPRSGLLPAGSIAAAPALAAVAPTVPVAPALEPASRFAPSGEWLEDSSFPQNEGAEPLGELGPPIRPESLAGLVLRGRFRLEKKLGAGAQAEVYLAQDQVLDREVAIKILSDVVAEDEKALERFLREARLAARVHHGSCLSIYDFGQERGLTFMAMEYFRGRTLRTLIERGPVQPHLALRIGREVALALGAVHGAGIVHRDVKPTNVLIARSGAVRLTDFGVARGSGDETSGGMMVGTMKYMAPEQARGREVDGRADIFSLGVVIWEMLAGRAPFGGTLDALIARVTKPPPELPEELPVGEDVREMLRRAMHKKPSGRHGTVQALLEELEPALAALERERRASREQGQQTLQALPSGARSESGSLLPGVGAMLTADLE